MLDLNILAVVVAGVAVFFIGFGYYAALGDQLAAASGGAAAGEEFPPWKAAVEFSRGLLLAAVVAGLVSEADVDELAGGLLLGLVLWVGFPFLLWIGAVIHEDTPVKVAVIHAGDWLVKLLVIGAIVSVWQ